MQITQRFAFEMMYRQYCCVITAYQFAKFMECYLSWDYLNTPNMSVPIDTLLYFLNNNLSYYDKMF